MSLTGEMGFCENRGWRNHFEVTRSTAYKIMTEKKAETGWGWHVADTRDECELERLSTLLAIASRIAFLADGTDSMSSLVVPTAKDGIVRHTEEAYGLLCRQLWDTETLLVKRRIELEERQAHGCVAAVAVPKQKEEEEVKLASKRVEEEIASRTAAAAAAETIEEAVECDNAHDYERAFSFYLSGLEWFEMAAKQAPSDSLRKRITTKMFTYLHRAEQIKAQLDQDACQMPAAVAKGSGGGGGELRSAVSSAIIEEKPKFRLKDVAGLVEAKQALREAVIVPYKAPQLWGENERSWSGILLYGPPGTGKSFLAKAIAGEANCTFFSLSSSQLVSKYVGESERLVSALFALAREKRPSIVFIDEIESILTARSGGDGSAHNDRLVTELLVQMDGVGHDNTGVLCLGATNLPWLIDQGARRRLERKIYIPLPDEDARARMLSSLSDRIPQSMVDELAVKTSGYSGADIASLIKDATMAPRRRVMTSKFFKPVGKSGTYVPCDECDDGAFEMTFDEFEDATTLRNPPLVERDFLEALTRIKPSVDPATLARYDEWTDLFGTK